MFSLFKRKRTKPKATVFVDYEHWYISLSKLHKCRPDVKGFRDALSKKYDVTDMIFFADFSGHSLRNELPRIRQVSNHIIETQSAYPSHKKDFTDFIMLDHIYQMAISSPQNEVFVLFSGDGHFSPVASYLISNLNKEVGVYAVRGALSSQLKNTASWAELLPVNNDPNVREYKMILASLNALKEAKQNKAYPTFKGTVTAVSRQNRVSSRLITSRLKELMSMNCISKEKKSIDGKNVKILTVDWKKCRLLGYWE